MYFMFENVFGLPLLNYTSQFTLPTMEPEVDINPTNATYENVTNSVELKGVSNWVFCKRLQWGTFAFIAVLTIVITIAGIYLVKWRRKALNYDRLLVLIEQGNIRSIRHLLELDTTL